MTDILNLWNLKSLLARIQNYIEINFSLAFDWVQWLRLRLNNYRGLLLLVEETQHNLLPARFKLET